MSLIPVGSLFYLLSISFVCLVDLLLVLLLILLRTHLLSFYCPLAFFVFLAPFLAIPVFCFLAMLPSALYPFFFAHLPTSFMAKFAYCACCLFLSYHATSTAWDISLQEVFPMSLFRYVLGFYLLFLRILLSFILLCLPE